MALDVLFISSRGSQYRYYKALARNSKFIARVVTLFPGFGFKVFGADLSWATISNGIAFHLERKRRKYTYKNPNIVAFKLYEWFSVLYFSLIYLKFRYYFERFQPSVVCVWNGHRLPEMAIKAAADGLGIKIAYFENGLLPDTTTMDFSGVNASSSLPKDPEFYLNYFNALEDDEKVLIDKQVVARKPHKKRSSLIFQEYDLSKEYVFVPFQVNFDSQVVINSPRINSMEALYFFLEAAVKKMGENSPIFLVKEHPSDVRTYSNFHVRNPKIIFVNNNTVDLIKNAKAVVTLNSSVGIEAAMLQANVIALGDACYKVKGLVADASNIDEFITLLKDIDITLAHADIRIAFFTYLIKEYLLPRAWQNFKDGMYRDHLERFDEKICLELGVGKD